MVGKWSLTAGCICYNVILVVLREKSTMVGNDRWSFSAGGWLSRLDCSWKLTVNLSESPLNVAIVIRHIFLTKSYEKMN